MRVKDLIEALQKCNQDGYVVGLSNDELEAVASGVVEEVCDSDWHDSLDRGENYVRICFSEYPKKR